MSDSPAPRRKRRTAVLLLAAALVTGGAALLLLDRTSHDRRDGLEAAKAGNFKVAEPLLLKALEREPGAADVVEALARGYLKDDDPRGEDYLSRWVELQPNNAEPLKLRLAIYHKRRDPRTASEARKLMDLTPDDAAARRTAMNHAFSYGLFAEAEELCRANLQRQPGDLSLRMMLGEIRRTRGDVAAAAEIYDAVLKDHPKNDGALLARAKLHMNADELDKAIPLLRTAFQGGSSRRAVGHTLGTALERVGQVEEARRVFAEVRRLQDLEVFSEAIKTQPENLALRVELAGRLMADGHAEDGVSVLRAVLALDPSHRPAHLALAAHFEKVGQAARAAEHRRLAGNR